MAQALAKALNQLDDLIARIQDSDQVSYGEAPIKTTAIQQEKSATREAAKEAKKAAKRAKQPKEQPVAASLADTFAKARIVVGIVRSAEILENSEKLYKCQVQIGTQDDDIKQIVAGLRFHVPQSEMEGRRVATILNLKTARLAGETSQGMILAAVQKGEQYDHGELVKPITVPEASAPGDAVVLKGTTAQSTYPKEFRQWSKVLPLLRVKNSNATFDGIELETQAGPITADPIIPDGAAIS